MGFLDMPNSAKVNKGAYTIFVEDYAGAGDGTAAGTAALQKAFTDAQGKTIVLGKQKTYTIASTISAPTDVTLVANGSKFLKNTIGSWGFITNTGFRADLLWVESPGHATSNDQGVYVAGSDVHIRHLKIVSTQGDTPGLNGAFIGNASATARTNLRIDRLEVTGWQRPVRIQNLADSCIANIDIRNFIVGVYLQTNVSNVTFPRATISGTSPASAPGPYNGMNGLLIEASADYNTQGLRFYDWTVDGAPEHSFRMGGSYTVADVAFTNCISRNPGNAPGNVSTGGGAFKCLGVVGHFHKNIRYMNCSATDSNTDGAGINNFTQFTFGFVDGLTLINPTVRAVNKTYSAQIALYLNAVQNVQVVNPDFRDTKTFAVFIGKDGTDSSGTGVANVKISGGQIHSATTHALYMDTQTTVTKDVDLENVKILGNATVARGVRTETVGSGGAYTNVNLDLKYTLNTTAGTEPALLLQPEMLLRYTGPVYGYSMSAANGSTIVNTTAGSFMLRKAGAWATL